MELEGKMRGLIQVALSFVAAGDSGGENIQAYNYKWSSTTPFKPRRMNKLLQKSCAKKRERLTLLLILNLGWWMKNCRKHPNTTALNFRVIIQELVGKTLGQGWWTFEVLKSAIFRHWSEAIYYLEDTFYSLSSFGAVFSPSDCWEWVFVCF